MSDFTFLAENRYKHEAMVDGEPILVEILDTCPKVIVCIHLSFGAPHSDRSHLLSIRLQMDSCNINNSTLDAIQWADGILLIYSITDRQSFNHIKRVKLEASGDIPVSLVGNKVDMIHLRQVSSEEGEILAKDFDCKFSELSAAEHVIQVADAFHDLCREVLAARRKSKQSLLDRMLGGTRVYARGKSDSALPKD